MTSTLTLVIEEISKVELNDEEHALSRRQIEVIEEMIADDEDSSHYKLNTEQAPEP